MRSWLSGKRDNSPSRRNSHSVRSTISYPIAIEHGSLGNIPTKRKSYPATLSDPNRLDYECIGDGRLCLTPTKSVSSNLEPDLAKVDGPNSQNTDRSISSVIYERYSPQSPI